MSSIFTKDFKTKLVSNFIADVANTNNASSKYYITLGRLDEWPNESAPTTANGSVQAYSYEFFNNMIAGKKINTSDVSYMLEKNQYTPNTVYDIYSHLDSDLQNKYFFVVTDSRSVYKCLFNNNGKPSNVVPTSTSVTSTTQLSDGYIWKYMGGLDAVTYNKFVTSTHIPAPPSGYQVNDLIKTAAINGTLDVILVTNAGNNYVNIINQGVIEEVVNSRVYKIANSGASTAQDYYNDSIFYIATNPGINQLSVIDGYNVNSSGKFILTTDPLSSVTAASKFLIAPQVKIVGDGTRASAYAVVNTSTYAIDTIKVVSKGRDYSYATASIIANSFFGEDATALPIISPPGGHGSNTLTELGCDTIGISVDFDSTVNTIPYFINYRQVGLLRNPLKVGSLIANSINLYSSNTFVQQLQILLDSSRTSGAFVVDESIKGSISKATGIVKYANSSYIMVANTVGTFLTNESISGTTSVATSSIDQLNNIDLRPNSGSVLYYRNIQDIQRTEISKEQIKLSIQF